MSVFGDAVVEERGILKSVNDKRSFKYLKLENGFQALLISEPKDDPKQLSESTNGEETDESSDGEDSRKMSAACLCVRVGTFEDPEKLPGLAHLLEHAITMGSKQYPKENVFDDYLSACGGWSNAHTEYEETFYEFESLNEDFEEALRIFASFFVSPLLNKSSIAKETKPVDSEFVEALSDDSCRLELLLQSFVKEGHPLKKFGWGNKQTLHDIPAKKKIDVHKHLVSFWKKYYVAENMAIVVQTQDDLDTLTKWITELFSSVPSLNGVKGSRRMRPSGSPFQIDFLKLYYLKPIEKQSLLTICWWVPSTRGDYETKPLDHIGSVVGHEGKGSLLSFLRAEGLALELEAGNSGESFEDNIYQSLFSVSVHLTDKGLSMIREVVNYVFSFIEMLQKKGPQKYYFEEEMKIALTNFRFKDDVCSSDEVVKLAKRFFHCPVEQIMVHSLFQTYDESVIKTCLDHLQRSEANIMIISQKAFEDCVASTKKEVWTKAEYKVLDIPSDWLLSKENPESVFDGRVTFPEPNNFIATDFSLVSPEEVEPYPTAIYQNEFCRLWFKADNKFRRPKACISFIFTTSANLNIRQTVALDLFVDILMQNLKIETYSAHVAGLEFSILLTAEKQFVLRLSGLNDKLPNLVNLIMEKIVNFELDNKLFDIMKEDIKKSYFNSFVDSKQLANSLRRMVLHENYFTALEKLKKVNDFTAAELLETVKLFFGSLFTECLIQGNFTAQQAEDIMKQVVSLLHTPTAFSRSYPQTFRIPKGEHILRVKTLNNEEKCSVIYNYYQIGPCDIRKFCLLELLVKAMEEPLFDSLRTQKGLGYEVSNQHYDTWGIGGFSIVVVSPIKQFNCDQVNESIENFLKEFATKIENMPKKLFQKLVRSRIQTKSIPDLSLKEEYNRNFGEITTRNYCYDRLNREIDLLKEIKLPEFQRWVLHHILEFPSRRKLSVQIVGNEETAKQNGVANGGEKTYDLDFIADKNKEGFIKNITNFKQSMNLFPATFVKN